MSAQTIIDQPSNSAQGVLDSLFGTASKGLDLWAQWQNKKAELTTAKAAQPSVAQPSPSIDGFAGVPSKVWMGLAAGAALLLGFVLLRRR